MLRTRVDCFLLEIILISLQMSKLIRSPPKIREKFLTCLLFSGQSKLRFQFKILLNMGYCHPNIQNDFSGLSLKCAIAKADEILDNMEFIVYIVDED